MARIIGFAGGAAINVNLDVEGPVFAGPVIEDLTLAVDVAIFPRDFSSRFAGSGLTFSVVGTLPTGLSLSSAGVLSGTPTVLGTTSGLIIRATDGANPDADSNEFAINIVSSIPSSGQPPGFLMNMGRMMGR